MTIRQRQRAGIPDREHENEGFPPIANLSELSEILNLVVVDPKSSIQLGWTD